MKLLLLPLLHGPLLLVHADDLLVLTPGPSGAAAEPLPLTQTAGGGAAGCGAPGSAGAVR